jgi:hypothetical protein
VHGTGSRQKVIHPSSSPSRRGTGSQEVHPSPSSRKGRASRRKGLDAERVLVRYLQARGFAAERVPLSGADMIIALA